MTDPLQYPSTTPLHDLPLLFPGQSQKEFFVNAALSRCDALLHPVIEGGAVDEPVAPEDGQAWLVAENATGALEGRTGMLAVRQSGTWQFVAVSDGMTVFDRATGQRASPSSATSSIQIQIASGRSSMAKQRGAARPLGRSSSRPERKARISRSHPSVAAGPGGRRRALRMRDQGRVSPPARAVPVSRYTVLRAAAPAYELYDVQKPVVADKMPPHNVLSAERLGYFIRPGKHAMTPPDWNVYMDFADKWLK